MPCKNCKCYLCVPANIPKQVCLYNEKGEKRCINCLKYRPPNEYHIASKKNGTRRADCIDCRKIVNRAYYLKRKEKKNSESNK